MSAIYSIIQKINRYLAEATGYVIGLLMLLLVFDSLGQLFNHQLSGVVEMAIFALVASAYLGLSYTEEMEGHVRVEAILKRLPTIVRKWVYVFWDLVGSIIIFATTYAAGMITVESYQDGEALAGAVSWPLYPIRAIITGCLLMFGIQLVANTIIKIAKPASEFT